MSGGGARVSIPGNVRKMIGEIKLIAAGKFNDEFINSLLKECGMNSEEVVERLKMIQEIKDIAKKHSNEDVHIMLKECNMDPNEAAQRLLYIDTFHEVKKKRDKKNANVNSGTFEDYKRGPGNQWQGARGGQGNYNSSNGVGGQRNVNTWKENGVRNRNRSERVSSSITPVQHNKENNVSPHMASSSPTHANGPTMSPDGFSNRGSSTQQSAVSGVYSSASDPAMVPFPNMGNADIPSTKIIEVSNRSGIAEAVATPFVGNTGSAVQDVAYTREAATDSLTVNSSIDSESSLNGTLKVVASEPVTTTVAVSDSIIGRECMHEESNPKLEKLTLSANLPVTFPDHLQVPETFKKRLTFGSLDAALGDENRSSSIVPVQGNDVMDASMSKQNVASTDREDEVPSHPLPLQEMPESAPPSEHSVLSDSSFTQEQPKQETEPLQGGSQFPFAHSTTSYGFVLPPHYLGILPPEVPEHQSGNSLVSAATPSATQSSGAAQSSLSPPPFPLFRHPFAHGYYPYGPYYPHYYWPPNAHHLISHGGFPQQPYVPPGVKVPVPSPYMQGSNAGNVGHFGVLSAYGAYGSSPVSYTADATPGSAGNEDVVASQTKEKNSAKSAVQQGEDLHVRAIAPSREFPNYFYNLPQGQQHMAISSPIYHHPSQTVTAQSSVQSPLHLSEPPITMASSGLVEAPVGPPSKSYEQPQQHSPQISWNILNSRENIQ